MKIDYYKRVRKLAKEVYVNNEGYDSCIAENIYAANDPTMETAVYLSLAKWRGAIDVYGGETFVSSVTELVEGCGFCFHNEFCESCSVHLKGVFGGFCDTIGNCRIKSVYRKLQKLARGL